VCQRLVPRADGNGRVVAMEVAVNTPRLAEAIADPERTDTVPDIVADGGYSGMQTFDQHLVRLVLDGSVSVPEAKVVSTNTHDFGVMLKRAGVDPALVDAEPAR
jgi:twitching motility protein PilT